MYSTDFRLKHPELSSDYSLILADQFNHFEQIYDNLFSYNFKITP